MNWQTADGLWTHLKPLVNQLYYPKHHLETSNRPSQQHKSWKTLAEYLQVTGNESSSPTENTWILMMMTMKMYVVQIRENHKHPSLLCDVETFIITEWRPWGEHEHLSRCWTSWNTVRTHNDWLNMKTLSLMCVWRSKTSALRRSLLCSAYFISNDACVDDSKRISSVCWCKVRIQYTLLIKHLE